MADPTAGADRAVAVDPAVRRRRTVTAAIAAAATLAMATIAIPAIPTATTDGRPIVLAATVVGTVAGLAGAWLITAGRIRAAGFLLVLAIVTPTYFAAVVNLVPFLLGVVLIVDSFRSDGLLGPRRRSGRRPRHAVDHAV